MLAPQSEPDRPRSFVPERKQKIARKVTKGILSSARLCSELGTTVMSYLTFFRHSRRSALRLSGMQRRKLGAYAPEAYQAKAVNGHTCLSYMAISLKAMKGITVGD